jgi:hypothetical protein
MLRRIGNLQFGMRVAFASMVMASAILLSAISPHGTDWKRGDPGLWGTRRASGEGRSMPPAAGDVRPLPGNSWIDWYIFFLKRNTERVASWMEAVFLDV